VPTHLSAHERDFGTLFNPGGMRLSRSRKRSRAGGIESATHKANCEHKT
jgi:hypothetical protein